MSLYDDIEKLANFKEKGLITPEEFEEQKKNLLNQNNIIAKNNENVSPKSRLVAAILCFFFGCLGVHRFYVGKIGTGILMILTFGGLGIWALIDFIIIIVGSFTDSEGKVLKNWND